MATLWSLFLQQQQANHLIDLASKESFWIVGRGPVHPEIQNCKSAIKNRAKEKLQQR